MFEGQNFFAVEQLKVIVVGQVFPSRFLTSLGAKSDRRRKTGGPSSAATELDYIELRLNQHWSGKATSCTVICVHLLDSVHEHFIVV
jgi:hypothetical protein